MGQRSRTASVAAVMGAFMARRTWKQADLARELELGTEALRKILGELRHSGIPLTDEKEPPHVYWSVPKTWFPGGVLFKQSDVPELLRQLNHLPATKTRDRLLGVVIDQLPARPESPPPVVSRPTSQHEEQYVPIVEDAAAKKTPLFMRYLTASRADIGERRASVHLIELGPPARFIATCHRNGDLRWFRVDGIIHGRVDDQEPFRESSPGAVTAYRNASLDGFKGAGAPIACSFFVRLPESRWVLNNLLDGMRPETLHDGIRVHVETSAIVRLARFVVGLGGAARPESAALAEVVAELARGALDQVQAQARIRDQASEIAAVSGAITKSAARPRSDV